MQFSDFGLRPSLLKTLQEKKLNRPTEIQSQSIMLLMSGQSVVGIAETGSGKTLAYTLPLLHQLKALEDSGESVTEEARPRAVILVPTRELGEQVSKVFKEYTHDTRLRVRPALGGMTFEHARRNTSGPFEVLVATPGRLGQMLDRHLVDLSDVRLLVFDEADQMMDQGFLPDSNRVVAACPEGVQLALFSATISSAVQELINRLFGEAEIVRSSGSGKVVQTLTTQNLTVQDGQRWPLFEKLLKQSSEGGTIVFTNTREQCDKLAQELKDKGYACSVYRGEMEKQERRQNLRKFSKGEVDLLVATDLAGRGLDIPVVGRVINYHLPKQMENYLHRAGRTARAGRKGLVVNLVTERDERLIAQLEGRKAKPFERKSKPIESKSVGRNPQRPALASPTKAAKPKVAAASGSRNSYVSKSNTKRTQKTAQAQSSTPGESKLSNQVLFPRFKKSSRKPKQRY